MRLRLANLQEALHARRRDDNVHYQHLQQA